MCARFIGNSSLDPVKPYITYSAHYILKKNSILPKYGMASKHPKHMFELYCPSHNNIAR
jgi:hypothetical protein